MRIARFSRGGVVSYGLVLTSDGATKEPGVVTGGSDSDGASDEACATGHEDDQLVVAQLAGHPFGGKKEDINLTGVSFALADVRLLAPMLPSKVVCIGR